MKKLFIILVSATLLFACGEEPAEVVTPGAEISIGVETMTFLASGAVAADANSVIVTSSGDWRLAGKKSWCVPSVVSGKSGDVVTFTVEENPTAEVRSIIYSFMCGDKTTKLVVTQGENTIIDLSQDIFNLDHLGASIKIRLESSIRLTPELSAEDQSWIVPLTTRATELSYLYYTVAVNDTHAPRKGTIKLHGEGLEQPRIIVINQAQNDEIKPGQTLLHGELSTETLRLGVWSNVPYTVQIPEDVSGWLSIEKQPDAPDVWSEQELVFHLTVADVYRMGSINLVAADGAITIPIGIQQGEPTIFQIPDANFRDYLLTEKRYIVAMNDGYTTTVAGAAATAIDTYTTLWQKKGCENLDGIENFLNLTTLNCGYNRLRRLDISKNVKISNVSQCVPNALESLSVGPEVTAVNFGATSAWASGMLYDYNTKSGYEYGVWSKNFTVTGENVMVVNVVNNKLTTLDVTGCPNLQMLRCTSINEVIETIYMTEAQRDNGVEITKDAATQIVYR